VPNIIVGKLILTEYFSSEEIMEDQVDIPFPGGKISSISGVCKYQEFRSHGPLFFLYISLNICGSWVWNLAHITFQTPRILR